MDKDRIIGAAKVIKGKMKIAFGKKIEDPKLTSEGVADKVEGKIQNGVGVMKDTVRDTE